jgi:DNA invertase Pin-like site-specific DNA recombinase
MGEVPSLEKKQAVIYLRVSTEEQVENYSLDTQSDICRKEAERRSLPVLRVFREEGRSAKTITERPTLIELLEFCRKHKRKSARLLSIGLTVFRVRRQTISLFARSLPRPK